MAKRRHYKHAWALIKKSIFDPKGASAILRNFNYHQGKKKNGWFADQVSRIAAEIKDWRDFLEEFEGIENPDRLKMMELYQEIELDDQVTSKMQSVKLGISGTEWYFYNTESKKEIEDLKNDIFDRRWFLLFLDWAVDSFFYGHSLIQFGDWDINKGYNHKQMELVPRHLVCPEYGVVKQHAGDLATGIPFRGNSPFAKNLIEIGYKYDKGIFASIAPLFIFKKNAMSYWSDFQQHYGEPILQIGTDTVNSKNLDTYYDFILNRGNSSGLVTDVDDEMKLLEAEKTDAYKVFDQMVIRCNDGISKAMEGQTMTTDSEGGKYDGDVHADTALLFKLGRLKSIKYYINDELLPKMRLDGFNIGEYEEFRWREFRNIDEIVNRITKLANYYHITPETVYDMTGIQVDKEREDVDKRGGNGKKVPDSNDK